MLPPDFTIHSRYRIIYAVDERPGSKVYRGRDDQTGRLVLVAALPLEGDPAQAGMDLLARQIATVHHESLLPLTDHFAEGAAYYFVCEDPGGQDLERALRARGGPLPESDVLTRSTRLLGCLDLLHNQRPPLYLGEPLPSDLLIGEDGAWRMAPFTLARPIGHAPSSYRAPELTASGVEPTAAGDLYAVGALLYQALTGWAPPSAEQQQAGTPLVGPRALNLAISPLAEQAILRAMQLRAANRYQAAREMRLALETVQIMGGHSPGLAMDVLNALPPSIVEPPAQPIATPAAYPQPLPPSGMAPEQRYPTGVYSTSTPAGGSSSPLGQPYPTGIYEAPPQRRPGLSTGCLVAIAIMLTLLAVGICIALLLFVPGSPLRNLFAADGIIKIRGLL